MDILVTTPKNEAENMEKECEVVEKDPNVYWFRPFRFKPKIEVGDRMFFVDRGLIRGYSIIFNYFQLGEEGYPDKMECITTKRVWGKPGDWILLHTNWQWLKKPVAFKGFQGYRKVNKLSQHIQDALYDQMTEYERNKLPTDFIESDDCPEY